MTRTPEEIKKGLECCASFLFDCPHCSYYEVGDGDCVDEVKRDALHYIQQLEAERDAAVRDLTEMAQDTDESCEYCAMFRTPHCSLECRMKNEGFKWRGVQKEDEA